MPRPSKGARLVWRAESRKSDGSLRSRAGWFVRDGSVYRSACGGTGDRAAAEKFIAAFIVEKYQPARSRGREPGAILIADVVNVYLNDTVARHASPRETAARLERVLDFFGGRRLTDINGQLCRDFVAQSATSAAARRQLEDLRAAINHFHREGYAMAVPAIALPAKPRARERWLTRQEAARLLRAAWRLRQQFRGEPTERRTGRHLARFILVALYTGTRSAAVCGAAIRPTPGHGYVDLERGVFYRRAAGAGQTKKRQPPVKLPTRLVAHMRRWRDSEIEGRPIARNFVVEWNGEPVGSVDKSFRAAARAAGLDASVTPHVLRHTAATWLMQAGVDAWEAAGFLGMTVQTLVDNYGHHHPEFQANAADAITSKRGAAPAGANLVRLAPPAQKPPHKNPPEKLEPNANIRAKG